MFRGLLVPAVIVWAKLLLGFIVDLPVSPPIFLELPLIWAHFWEMFWFIAEKDVFKFCCAVVYLLSGSLWVDGCWRFAVEVLLNLAILLSKADIWFRERFRSWEGWVCPKLAKLELLAAPPNFLMGSFGFPPRLSELLVDFQELPFWAWFKLLSTC